MPTTATSPAPTPVAGAIAFAPNNYVPMGETGATPLGTGGFAYTYQDTGSVACLNSSVFCTAGTVATTGYGAGTGVNLNQPTSGGNPLSYAVPAAMHGVAYTLSNLPTSKTLMIIDNNAVAYQVTLATATAMVPWSSFTIQTADAGPPTLAGPPTALHINFQMAAGTFNFCVTSLNFY